MKNQQKDPNKSKNRKNVNKLCIYAGLFTISIFGSVALNSTSMENLTKADKVIGKKIVEYDKK